jgi:hypothetical protein
LKLELLLCQLNQIQTKSLLLSALLQDKSPFSTWFIFITAAVIIETNEHLIQTAKIFFVSNINTRFNRPSGRQEAEDRQTSDQQDPNQSRAELA